MPVPSRRGAAIAALLLLAPEPVLAHAGERGFIMLLPTGLYQAGGAAVVAISFAAMAWVHAAPLRRWLASARTPLGVVPRLSPWSNLLCALLLAALVAAGFLGSRDPLSNPLPLSIWTLTWVGLTLGHALLGNFWPALEPWSVIARGVRAVARAGGGHTPTLPYPAVLGHWPAVTALWLFAAFELLHPAPQDPGTLARVVLGYSVFTITGMALFGPEVWNARVELFSRFFRMVSWVAPLQQRRSDPGTAARLELVLPCARLLCPGGLPVAGVCFVILALATVSFDGLSRTFWWLDLLGENPLEHPGRTALVARNGAGMAAAALTLLGAYALSAVLGARISGMAPSRVFRTLVVSLVPIALGYHIAHYLPSFLVDAQHALKALSDPLHRGWNLLGARDLHVTASFLTHHTSVRIIWYAQVCAIVTAHLAAVVVAHALLGGARASRGQSLLAQAPLSVLMVAYTLFGLWLLSTPVAA